LSDRSLTTRHQNKNIPVEPVHPSPPHCAQCAAVPEDGGLVGIVPPVVVVGGFWGADPPKSAGESVLDAPFCKVRLMAVPRYRTLANVPDVLFKLADVRTPFDQAISTVKPPRARKPVTRPSFHEDGIAGRRWISPL
jgi:hypothetical protein